MSAVLVNLRSSKARFDYADMLAQHLHALNFPPFEREFRPFADRRFRLDIAWPQDLLFVETDGGEWVKGSARRHGGAKDCERWNLLILAGWTGFRFVGSQVRSGLAVRVLEQAFGRTERFPIKPAVGAPISRSALLAKLPSGSREAHEG